MHERILVADPSTELAQEIAQIVDDMGLAVIAADSGNKVLALHRTARPDGAILDVDLPLMSGVETCQRLKNDEPSLPVYLLFDSEAPENDALARRAGADNYLVRPLTPTEMLFCIRAMLTLRRLLGAQATSGQLRPRAPDPDTAGIVSLDVYYRFLELEVRRAARYGFPLSILAVMVDPLPGNFEPEWVHTLDSQLGPALSAAIRACVREIDLSTIPALREALVLMPHTDLRGATLVAGRLRERMASQPYQFGRTQFLPTVSIGVASIHGRPTTAAQLLTQAKGRRERAINAGGNRVMGD